VSSRIIMIVSSRIIMMVSNRIIMMLSNRIIMIVSSKIIMMESSRITNEVFFKRASAQKSWRCFPPLNTPKFKFVVLIYNNASPLMFVIRPLAQHTAKIQITSRCFISGDTTPEGWNIISSWCCGFYYPQCRIELCKEFPTGLPNIGCRLSTQPRRSS
jgi:hypothetical protein